MKSIWAPWRGEYIGAAKSKTCPFCHARENPKGSHLLYSDKVNIIILNKYPYTGGHLLISPIRHIAAMDELTSDESQGLFSLASLSVTALKSAFKPHGFNIGMNLGTAAGAGIANHIHMHVVPRWDGDTNFMPVISKTKVLSMHLDETYKILKPLFNP